MKDVALLTRAPEVFATEYARSLKGGSKSILCAASDGHRYVVKPLNNPQGSRCVVNDLFASILAREIGLPVPQPALVRITTEFVKRSRLSPEQTKALGDCELHFGSRVPVDPNKLATYDYWPKHPELPIANASDVIGCWLFDAWTSNADGFQYVVHRQPGGSYRFWKIDHGFCFMAQHWTFEDTELLRGGWVELPMRSVATMKDFEPYLSRIKTLPLRRLRRIATAVPKGWLGGDVDQFNSLIFCLHIRKALIEELIAMRWPSGKLGELRMAVPQAAGGIEAPCLTHDRTSVQKTLPQPRPKAGRSASVVEHARKRYLTKARTLESPPTGQVTPHAGYYNVGEFAG